jgi:hypothetical protein
MYPKKMFTICYTTHRNSFLAGEGKQAGMRGEGIHGDERREEQKTV